MPMLGIHSLWPVPDGMLVAASLYFLFVQRSIATVSTPAEIMFQIE